MTRVSGPLITAVRGFDPRHLSNLELWLPHFNIPAVPGGDSLASGDNWPGAPPLGEFPGSSADGRWSDDPSGQVYLLDESASSGPIWSDPWVIGARGLVSQSRQLALVDTGTTTPRTFTITGSLTLVTIVRNTGVHMPILHDGGDGSTGILRVGPSSVSARNPELGSITIMGDIDGALDADRVYLVMVTRSSSNIWRVWVDGEEQSDSGLTNQDGTFMFKVALDDGVLWACSNVLLYSEDHSSRVNDLTAYFAGQFGAAAP